jgi:hypothetical protein
MSMKNSNRIHNKNSDDSTAIEIICVDFLRFSNEPFSR